MGKGKSFHVSESRHLAKSILLEETGTPLIMRMVVLFGGAIVIVFMTWAMSMSVDEVAITSGEIVPLGKVQQVQHWEGGIIREILVRDGDTVKAGQVVMRLEPSMVRSELGQTRARLEALMAQKERLKAFIEEREPDFVPLELHNKSLAEEQMDIYFQILQSRMTSRKIVEEQIEQFKAEMAGLDARKQRVESQKASLKEEISLRQDLGEKGLIENPKILSLSLQRVLSGFEGELQEIAATREKTVRKISEMTSRLDELDQKLMEDALKELAEIDTELAQVQEILRRHETNLDFLSIRAPVSGIAHGLKTHTIGGVIPSGSTILEIVPEGRRLVAEVKITSRDIGHVRVGQQVLVKFTTYDFGRYGGVKGELVEISATTFLDAAGQPYYKGIVRLEKGYIGLNPQINPVLPGMTVQADIKTGSKTVMEYLLKPIYTSAQHALRER